MTSRVSPRRATYFFCFAKKRRSGHLQTRFAQTMSHVRAASRCLALLAAFGAHLQTRFAQTVQVTACVGLHPHHSPSFLIRTLLRCSPLPVGEEGGCLLGGYLMAGGYLSARPLRATRSPNEWLLRSLRHTARPLRDLAANLAECWGFLISHASLLSRARHAVPLQPSKTAAVSKLRHSARSRGIHVSLHSNIDAATTRSMTACAGHRCPHHPHHSPSFLTPHSTPVIPGLTRNLSAPSNAPP